MGLWGSTEKRDAYNRKYHATHKTEHNARSKAHYEQNRVAILSAAKQRRDALQELIRGFKNVPCADCHQSFPHYVMEFDHVRGKKLFTIFRFPALGRRSVESLIREIEKCEVVCANCHATRTYKRRQKRVEFINGA